MCTVMMLPVLRSVSFCVFKSSRIVFAAIRLGIESCLFSRAPSTEAYPIRVCGRGRVFIDSLTLASAQPVGTPVFYQATATTRRWRRVFRSPSFSYHTLAG